MPIVEAPTGFASIATDSTGIATVASNLFFSILRVSFPIIATGK